MRMLPQRVFSIVATATLAALMMQPRLEGAPITSMDGVIGDFTLSAVGGSGSATLTINNLTVATSKLNGTAILPITSWIPTTFSSPIPIPVTGAGVPNINFDISKVIGPGGVDVTSGNAPVTGTAQFDANLNVIVVTPFTMSIQGNETLLFDSSSLDFTQFTSGSLVFTFNVSAGGTTFPQIFQHAASGSGTISLQGSASFSQSNVLLDVPEPASLALWCLAAFVALAVGHSFAPRRSRD